MLSHERALIIALSRIQVAFFLYRTRGLLSCC
jgi:hypothetical protein